MENEEILLEHFGTTDMEKIDNMIECLQREKRHKRIEEYAKKHPEKDYFECANFIVSFARYIGREKASLRKNGYASQITTIERIIHELDKKILVDDFVKQGLSRDFSEELVDYNYALDDIWGIKSLVADDYIISGSVLIQKSEKEKYARYLKMQKDNEQVK